MITRALSNTTILSFLAAIGTIACGGATESQPSDLGVDDGFDAPAEVEDADPVDETDELDPASDEPGLEPPVGSRIRGYVDEAHQERIAEADVCAWHGDESYCTTTDAEGRYEIRGVPEGETLVLAFGKDGYFTGADVIDVDYPTIHRNGHLLSTDSVDEGELPPNTGALLVQVVHRGIYFLRAAVHEPVTPESLEPFFGELTSLDDQPTATSDTAHALFTGITSGSLELSASALVGEGCAFFSVGAVGETTTIDIFDGSVTAVRIACPKEYDLDQY